MKVAFYTLGCKVNQNDSASLTALFRNRNYEVVPFRDRADIYVINTCSVTRISDRKSAQTIRRAINLAPDAVVVVTGCLAQTAPQEIAAIPGVNLVVGMVDRGRIVEIVEDYIVSKQNKVVVADVNNTPNSFWSHYDPIDIERTRATLKVEEGCDQFCSYCIVPYARGRVQSMPLPEVKQSIELCLTKGFKEIVLTGIHLGAYGKDLNLTLDDLLQEIVAIPGDFRIRLGSIEPNDLSEPLIDLITSHQKICQYLHIPLQSGSDRILEAMNRGYTTTDYQRLLERIRKLNPLIAVGTDLIIGFPGETENHFAEICDFVSQQGFSRIHVFRFSPRQGTKAFEMTDRISPEIQVYRSDIIQQIAARSASEYAQQFKEKSVRVLFEEQRNGIWSGFSSEYLRVETNSDQDLKNCFRGVEISQNAGNNLIGHLLLY